MPSLMENIRRVVRGIIGPNNPLYRQAAISLDYLLTVKTEGVEVANQLQRLDRQKSGKMEALKLNSLQYPIWIRPGTLDASTVISNVIREEYGKLLFKNMPRWIIDAGAYIGDTSAYFLNRYPEANIIALEPHDVNYAMCEKNLKPYGDRVQLLQKGLFSEETQLTFTGEGTAGSIGEGDGFTIETTTIPNLLKDIPGGHIDLLKMDIEGAEKDIFEANASEWLPKIDHIIVELHSPEITTSVLTILRENGWSSELYRSVWYCSRNQ